jgi:hypothetical protein
MRVTKQDIDTITRLLKKMQEDQKHEKMIIDQRRKAQLRGKTISRITQKSRKPSIRRKPAKRSVSRR